MTIKQFWNIQTQGKTSHIDLFGFVGGSKEFNDGFNETDFLNELRAIPADNALNISINSFGGSVYTALSIYSLLKNHKGSITFRVDGTAMSAATIITSVPNARVVMPRGSMMMIHKVSVGVYGNADDLKKTVDDIEKLEQNVLEIYAEKTGKSIDVIQALVDKETYFTADEALAFGLADEIDESKVIENRIEDDVVSINGLSMQASIFAHAPKNFFKPGVKKKEEQPMNLEKLKNEYPDLFDSIVAEARALERERIREIEEIAMAGHEALVNAAKFDGVTTASMLAIQMIKAEKARSVTMLADRAEDAKELEGTHDFGNVGPVENKVDEEKALQDRLAAICNYQGGIQ